MTSDSFKKLWNSACRGFISRFYFSFLQGRAELGFFFKENPYHVSSLHVTDVVQDKKTPTWSQKSSEQGWIAISECLYDPGSGTNRLNESVSLQDGFEFRFFETG